MERLKQSGEVYADYIESHLRVKLINHQRRNVQNSFRKLTLKSKKAHSKNIQHNKGHFVKMVKVFDGENFKKKNFGNFWKHSRSKKLNRAGRYSVKLKIVGTVFLIHLFIILYSLGVDGLNKLSLNWGLTYIRKYRVGLESSLMLLQWLNI